MNNPFNDPEFWDRPLRVLDPEFDIPEEPETFQFTLENGTTFFVMGEEAREDEAHELREMGTAFTVTTVDF